MSICPGHVASPGIATRESRMNSRETEEGSEFGRDQCVRCWSMQQAVESSVSFRELRE